MKETIDKKEKTIKQRYNNLKYKIKKWVNWNKKYLHLKYYQQAINISLFLNTLFTFIIYSILISIFLWSIGAMDALLETDIKNFNLLLGYNFSWQELVMAQISMTLLILTVLSLISNSENKFIYGEKSIEVVFKKKGGFSIRNLFYLLLILMLANLSFIIKQANYLFILVDFLTSVLILVHITLKFLTLYMNPELIKKRLKLMYLKENHKHITHAVPLDSHKSVKLERFADITIQHIQNANLEYTENINLYFYLLDVYLFKNKNKVQEYYTEYINHSDFIAHISKFTITFLQKDNIDEAIDIYIRLLKKLNYYKVVIVCDMMTSYIINKFIENIRYIKTPKDIKDISYRLFDLLKEYWNQLYLCNSIDFSYCRLKKVGLNIHFWTDRCILSNYYEALFYNKFLNTNEKTELIEACLYDNVRMLNIKKRGEIYCIDDFMRKAIFSDETVCYPTYLYAEPITLMFLKMYELGDKHNFKNFFTMNLDNEIFSYVKILLKLAFKQAFIRGRKIYRIDIEVSEKQYKEINQSQELTNINVSNQKLQHIYFEITKYYVSTNQCHEDKEYVYYVHYPHLTFELDTVNQVFKEIATQKNYKLKTNEI